MVENIFHYFETNWALYAGIAATFWAVNMYFRGLSKADLDALESIKKRLEIAKILDEHPQTASAQIKWSPKPTRRNRYPQQFSNTPSGWLRNMVISDMDGIVKGRYGRFEVFTKLKSWIKVLFVTFVVILVISIWIALHIILEKMELPGILSLFIEVSIFTAAFYVWIRMSD